MSRLSVAMRIWISAASAVIASSSTSCNTNSA
jgi:hypothetical protein